MLNQSYFHTMKFNLGDYDLGDLCLGDFSLGDLGLGDFNLGDFNLGDFDLIPTRPHGAVDECVAVKQVRACETGVCGSSPNFGCGH